jgi:Tol biopolymer transport system component
LRKHASTRTAFGISCLCVLGLAAFLGSSAPSVGAAESFPGQGFLPDNRAWEMVSPPDKHGANIAPAPDRVHAAADGEGVAFASLVPFGDARGTAFDTEYLAQRDAAPETNGWVTHGITPQQSPSVVIAPNVASLYQDFSADLSRAAYLSLRPLSDAPNVAPVPNLYLRDDLTTPGAGSYRLLTDSLTPVPKILPGFEAFSGLYIENTKPLLVGASANFDHVTFESKLGLTADSPMQANFFELLFGAQMKLYENAGGEVRYVGRVPTSGSFCDDTDGPTCEAAPGSQAALEATEKLYTEHTISRDGSRIFFQAPASPVGGNLYMREGGTRTFQLNASEKTPADASQPAKFWDASSDGSRSFFTTAEQLVEEDDDTAPDLYMYDAEKPQGERLTLVSASRTANNGYLDAVVGASANGHYVYFVSDGQLVAGEPPAELNGLYLWHDGDLSYIGKFGDIFEAQHNSPSASWLDTPSRRTSRISPDGRHLLFMVRSNGGFEGRGGFGGYDQVSACQGELTNACRELYVYDADSGKLRCASCNPSGTPATTDAYTDARVSDAIGVAAPTRHPSHALSDDGRYVFFSSQESLVPEDTNGTWDAYVYDTESEEVHLLSSGEDDKPSYFMDASADGKDAFIATAEPLSRWDTDDAYDIYDARVGGGLPEPKLAPPACQGDACQPAPEQLNDPTPASASFKGAGNQMSRHRTQKHHSKKRHRKANKHKRVSRHAHNNRRAGR